MPILPLCSNPKFSNENAEKVVKPPQIPVARNNFQLSEMPSPLILMANTRPIIKQPMIFTDSVANGNSLDLINKDVPYLTIEPMLPPKPTSNKFLIIGFYGFEGNVYFKSISHFPFILTAFKMVVSKGR